MARKRFAHGTDNFKHPESPRVSVAERRQDKGSKKTPETDAIFENVWKANKLADACSETLRISMDTKAIVNVGEYSRHGRSRSIKPVGAWDHDMRPKEKLVPGGSDCASGFFAPPRRSLRHDRQIDHERCAASKRAIDPDAPATLFDTAVHRGKPES